MKKIIMLLIVTLFGVTLCGCVITDYGYEFHFDVDGGNGKITIENDISKNSIVPCSAETRSCELNCKKSSYVASLLGGKNGSHELTFVATPDEDYQVREWLFNGEIVEGNKTNKYVAKVTSEHGYNGVISVKFELIQPDKQELNQYENIKENWLVISNVISCFCFIHFYWKFQHSCQCTRTSYN